MDQLETLSEPLVLGRGDDGYSMCLLSAIFVWTVAVEIAMIATSGWLVSRVRHD